MSDLLFLQGHSFPAFWWLNADLRDVPFPNDTETRYFCCSEDNNFVLERFLMIQDTVFWNTDRILWESNILQGEHNQQTRENRKKRLRLFLMHRLPASSRKDMCSMNKCHIEAVGRGWEPNTEGGQTQWHQPQQMLLKITRTGSDNKKLWNVLVYTLVVWFLVLCGMMKSAPAIINKLQVPDGIVLEPWDLKLGTRLLLALSKAYQCFINWFCFTASSTKCWWCDDFLVSRHGRDKRCFFSAKYGNTRKRRGFWIHTLLVGVLALMQIKKLKIKVSTSPTSTLSRKVH